VFFDLKVYGRHYVPPTGGVLLVSNHQSFLDPIVLSSAVDRTLSYLAKSELFRTRLFGGLLRSLNAFPVEQGAGDIGAVKEAIARLQEGHLLNVFPEGSRTDDGEMARLEKGVALVVPPGKGPRRPGRDHRLILRLAQDENSSACLADPDPDRPADARSLETRPR